MRRFNSQVEIIYYKTIKLVFLRFQISYNLLKFCNLSNFKAVNLLSPFFNLNYAKLFIGQDNEYKENIEQSKKF